MLLIPDFQPDGNLPPGIHWAEISEIERRFAINPHRRRQLEGFKDAAKELQQAGCKALFLDGSYVTTKDMPGDYDACWAVDDVDPSKLDPVFFDFSNRRAAQKARFLGEFFPGGWPEGLSGRTFLDFFQLDRDTGKPKGIIGFDLERWQC